MIPFQVLSQYYKVVTALVLLTILVFKPAACHIHLTSNNRLEQSVLRRLQLFSAFSQFFFRIFRLGFSFFQSSYFLLQILDFAICPSVFLVYIIEKLLDTEHGTMVSYSNTLHSIGYSLIYQLWYRGLSVKD